MTSTDSPTRYGCHECREDSELVMSNRATPEVRAQYEQHISQCRHCRRMHRLLYAVYEGPVVPPPLAGIPEEKEFHSILRRMKDEKPAPWYQKWAVGFGVTALAGSAAALTFTLFDVNPLDHIPGSQASDPVAVASDPTTGEPVSPGGDGSTAAGSSLRHAAQAYGRIVGGSATVTADGSDEPSTSNTFGVGTKFEVSQNESLQVGLVGKMVANFSPGSEVTWATGSPSLIELEVDEGVAAIRYDRDQSDPILQIRTPNALVRVVGTVFTVQVDDEAGTVVSVLRGQVDVLDPSSHRTVAEVESGYRYDVTKGTFDDVGKLEVQAALPIASVEEGNPAAVPVSWNVPGLPQDPTERSLANVPARAGEPLVTVRSIRVMGTTGPSDAAELPAKNSPRKVKNEGDDVIAQLMADAKIARRKELRQALRTCKDLYESQETRYRAATCFQNFLDKYDGQPAAAEAYAMLGLLRMDYALDYKAAEVALQTYLKRAPNGVHAELALYRMWLCAVEDGRISQAIKRGSKYLDRYPNGRFVGNILQRFPELHSEIQ